MTEFGQLQRVVQEQAANIQRLEGATGGVSGTPSGKHPVSVSVAV